MAFERVFYTALRGTAAEFEQVNPVLGNGIMAIETNTGQAKIGNGINQYNSIPYLGSISNLNGLSVQNLGSVESNAYILGASGSAVTLDTSMYNVFDITMDQNCQFTFSNPAPTTKLTSFILILRGAFTPTFPNTTKWSDGQVPTYGSISIYIFSTIDEGASWFGGQSGKSFA